MEINNVQIKYLAIELAFWLPSLSKETEGSDIKIRYYFKDLVSVIYIINKNLNNASHFPSKKIGFFSIIIYLKHKRNIFRIQKLLKSIKKETVSERNV